jgi:hypothetical protein
MKIKNILFFPVIDGVKFALHQCTTNGRVSTDAIQSRHNQLGFAKDSFSVSFQKSEQQKYSDGIVEEHLKFID